MNTITFMFNQLRGLSVDTELLEACDWDSEVANSMIDILNESFEKNKNMFSDLHSAKDIIRKDLLSSVSEERADVLLKIFCLIFENESKNLTDMC